MPREGVARGRRGEAAPPALTEVPQETPLRRLNPLARAHGSVSFPFPCPCPCPFPFPFPFPLLRYGAAALVSMVEWYLKALPLICTITMGLSALRSALMVMAPVAP